MGIFDMISAVVSVFAVSVAANLTMDQSIQSQENAIAVPGSSLSQSTARVTVFSQLKAKVKNEKGNVWCVIVWWFIVQLIVQCIWPKLDLAFFWQMWFLCFCFGICFAIFGENN